MATIHVVLSNGKKITVKNWATIKLGKDFATVEFKRKGETIRASKDFSDGPYAPYEQVRPDEG